MNADHLARRQSPPPAAATTPHVLRLEPYPNAAIRSLTMADDVLVVALRSGIQLFQSSESAATTASAVWELVERRDDYDLAEAYLCVGLDVGELMQPSSPDVVAAGQGEEEEELASCFKRFSRYFCVASAGLDSTTHSISVLSTRAHFHVRHELHDRRRVACIHFSMIATKPLQPKEARPFAVSVDVSGCVVVMDVLRGRSVRLTCAPPTFDEVLQHLRAHGFGGRSLREAGREEVEAYLLAALEHNSRDDDEHTFFLPDGVVPTAIRLTCPCWELCNKCNNVFVDANDGGERLMPLTLFISTTCSTTSTVAIRRVHFLWSSMRAVVLESSITYSVCVPPHAGTGGGAGLALVAFHYAVGVPTTMWAANMGMRMQRYRACDGHAVGSPTKAVLHQSLSSTTPTTPPATSSASSTTEDDEKNNFFCRCIPIGRYAVRGHHTLTWMCWVVGTRTGVLMLAGTDGRARMEAGVAHDSKVDGTGSAELEAWLNHDDDDDDDNGSTPTPSTSKDTGEEQFTVLAELYRPPAVVASTSSAWTEVLLHQGGRSVLVCVGNAKAILRLPLPLLTVAEADLASPTSSHAPPSPSASGVPPTPPQSSSNEASASMEKNASTGWGWSSAATTFARGWRGYLPNTPASPTWDIARPIASALVQFSSPTREAAAPPLPRMSVASNNTSITSLPEPATAVVAAPTTTSTQDTVEVEGAPASDVQERDEDDCVERICTKQHVRREIVQGPTRCLPNPDDTLSYLSTVLGSMSATVDPVALSSATSRVEKEDGWVLMQQREVEARRALAYEAQDSLRDMYRIYLSACVEPLQQSAATTMMCANLRSPSASPTTTTTAPPSRLLVPISRAMTRGMRAPRFMHELAMLRGRASAGQRRRWDLLAAVQTSSPAWMQRISDQHEREKCLFELADLRLRQAEELRHAGVAQLVRLFQNQERASTAVHGESAWVAVRGYAYEDESGAVADLERWTRWADGAVEKKWRWMTAEEAEDVDGGGATSVPQRRFLWDRRYREWCVGPWSYAAEWPADADEGGTSAVWWAEDLPSATVRRRAISRRRIELAVEAEHQRLRAKHLAESEALRKELDL